MNRKEENNRRKEFVKIFQEKIFPQLKSHEVARKRLLKNCIVEGLKAILFSLIVILLCFFVCKLTNKFISGAYFIIFVAILLSLAARYLLIFLLKKFFSIDAQIGKFIRILKKECVPRLLKTFGDVELCDCNKITLKTELKNSGLFLEFFDYHNDDLFVGKYKGVKFEIFEPSLMKSDVAFDTANSIVFMGVVLLFYLDKCVNNKTIVSPKYCKIEKHISCVDIVALAIFFLYYFILLKNIFNFGWENDYLILIALIICHIVCIFYSEIKRRNKEEKLDKIILEDPQFNKKYNAYSSDQVEGRYILTTAFIERFQNLQTAFKSKNIKCSFYDNKLMIAISTNKNLFEICNINKSFENTKDILEFYKQVSSIYQIIDYFKLDKKV